MTPQEQDMIDGLVSRVQQTQLAEKDPEAEARLQQGLSANPDTLYILAQTVLVQKFALEQAQSQLAQSQLQLAQAREMVGQVRQQPQAEQHHAVSFLGNLFGFNDPPPPQPSAASSVPYVPPTQPSPPARAPYAQPQPTYAPSYAPPFPAQPGFAQPGFAQPGYPEQGYAQPGYAPAPASSGSFLRSAGQTAMGVAAGALAFEGISSLMHGGGGGGSGLGGFGGGMPGSGRPEEIVNNYYGDTPQHHEASSFADTGRQDTASFQEGNYDRGGASHDSGNSLYDDTASTSSNDDPGGSDTFTSSSDDSASFSDSGSDSDPGGDTGLDGGDSSL